MARDWLRFLTTALGLFISVGFYGAPTKALIPHAEVASVSLQSEMAAETDSAPDAPSTDESEEASDESEESEADGE